MLPPLLSALFPPCTTRRPPTPSVPDPLNMLILPDAPPDAWPECMAIEPELPDDAVPELNDMPPDTPDDPDSAVAIVNAPLVDTSLKPVVIEMLPPVAV